MVILDISKTKKDIEQWQAEIEERQRAVQALEQSDPDMDTTPLKDAIVRLERKIAYAEKTLEQEVTARDALRFVRDRCLMWKENKDVDWFEVHEVVEKALEVINHG